MRLMLPLIPVLLSVLTLPACTKSKVLARVGSLAITEEDVRLRDQVIQFYYPSTDGSHGLEQLKQSFLNAEILANNGMTVTREVLEKEADRIEKTTLMPDKLKEIKAIFGRSTDKYLHVYVLPTYADRVIYFEFFPSNHGIHAPRFNDANQYLQAAMKGKAPAVSSEVKKVKFRLTPELGLDFIPVATVKGPRAPDARNAPSEASAKGMPESVQKKLQDAGQTRSVYQQWQEKIIPETQVSKYIPEVIDMGDHFLVAKRTKENEFEGFLFPKENYEKWHEAEARKIKVE